MHYQKKPFDISLYPLRKTTIIKEVQGMRSAQSKKSKQPKQTLQELNLLNRFLFAEAAEDREFLETVLEIIFEGDVSLKYPPQVEKEVRGGLRKKKIGFDVWDLDEGDVIYDTEVQDRNTGNLPRRSRYYQGLMDSKLLPEGTVDYNRLNDIIIILIAPFDLFGKGRYRYIFSMMCEEDPEVKLRDGATRIFLNTRGENCDGVSEELIWMLRYFENTTAEVAEASGSERILVLHEKVEDIRNNEEIGVKLMNAMEEKLLERQAGFDDGFEEGEASGFERGEASGIEKGKALGETYGRLEVARNMLNEGMEKANVSKMTGLSIKEIETI